MDPVRNLLGKRLFTPGPVMMSAETLAIGAWQTPYFRNQSFSDILHSCEQALLALVNADEGSRVVFLTASGTAAMEATIMNLLSKDTPSVVINGGSFGQRFVDMCCRHAIPVTDAVVDRDDLTDGLCLASLPTADALLINAHETSVGHLYSIQSSGQYCIQRNMLHIVDAISAFVTDEVDMQKQYIDALILSSHKGLALPPGLAMVVLGPRAIERIQPTSNLYFDFQHYLKDGERGQTPFTPAVTIVLQLHARLQQLHQQGLLSAQHQAKELASYFRQQLPALGLSCYAQAMPNAMTAVQVSGTMRASDLVARLEHEFDCVVAPNGGNLKDSIFRVAHMGNMQLSDLTVLVDALAKIIGERA